MKSAEPALAFLLHAEQVRLPTAPTWPLGPQIERLTVEGNLAGPVPNARTLAERVGAWRDGDGTLELQRFALIWGPLDLTASARLSLDTQLQPMGTGSVRAVGYGETLDALAAHGAISKSSALAAKAVLSLLAHNPEDGGPPDVEVPLTLQVPHAVDAPGAAGAVAGAGLAMMPTAVAPDSRYRRLTSWPGHCTTPVICTTRSRQSAIRQQCLTQGNRIWFAACCIGTRQLDCCLNNTQAKRVLLWYYLRLRRFVRQVGIVPLRAPGEYLCSSDYLVRPRRSAAARTSIAPLASRTTSNTSSKRKRLATRAHSSSSIISPASARSPRHSTC